jgi:hypothetical protein
MTSKLSRPELEYEWAIWGLPTFEGLPFEDPQAWLTRVDDGCQILNIPVSQRMLTAIHFLRGPLKVVMKTAKLKLGYLEPQQEIPSCVQKWDTFKDALRALHGDFACCLLCLDRNVNIFPPERRINSGLFIIIASFLPADTSCGFR